MNDTDDIIEQLTENIKEFHAILDAIDDKEHRCNLFERCITASVGARFRILDADELEQVNKLTCVYFTAVSKLSPMFKQEVATRN